VIKDKSTGTWRKSSFCESSGCVELSETDSHIYMRNSSALGQGTLDLTHDQWGDFISAIRAGAFDGQ
jgi:hypothetical protein